MTWNWQQADWPNFSYDASTLDALERQFLLSSGEFIGAFRHINAEERDQLRIELIGDEALTTSEIEGEILNRDSLQSSLRKQFGLGGGDRNVPLAEQGMAEMMVELYNTFADPLTHTQLHRWQRMVMADARH